MNPLTERLTQRIANSMELEIIDAHVEALHQTVPKFHSVEELPLSPHQKACALEWLAHVLSQIKKEVTDETYATKPFDPLHIEVKKKIAHSCVFQLSGGERHHAFSSLKEVENDMIQETLRALIPSKQ